MKQAPGRARRSWATAQSQAVEKARSGEGGGGREGGGGGREGGGVAVAVSVTTDAVTGSSVGGGFLARAGGAGEGVEEASVRHGWALRSSRIWAPSS